MLLFPFERIPYFGKLGCFKGRGENSGGDTIIYHDETVFPNATPITTPTARSITLPLIANCLNSET